MPTKAELSAMAQACGYPSWGKITEPRTRERIMTLALNAKRNEILAAIQNDTGSVAQVMWNR